jgi:hypothetical protein
MPAAALLTQNVDEMAATELLSIGTKETAAAVSYLHCSHKEPNKSRLVTRTKAF